MPSNQLRWTPEEDELLRSTKSQREAERLISYRTYEAVKFRRRSLRLTSGRPPSRPWKKGDDKRLLKNAHESPVQLAKRFKGRSARSIKNRVAFLGCGRKRKQTIWFAREIGTLEGLWPLSSRAEILKALPRHSWPSIAARAYGLGFVRKILERCQACNSELRGQIRRRAKEDGISIAVLSKQLGAGHYFIDVRTVAEDYNKIAKAVAFFGGRLVIDWQDE